MLNKIEIRGYKSIRDLDMDLSPINVLIGANGSGKSNFLSFFEFLKHIYNTNTKEYVALKGGADKFLYNGSKVTSEISAKLSFPKTNGYSFLLKKGDEHFVFSKEGLWYDNPRYENPTDIANSSTEARIGSYTMPRAGYIRKYLGAIEKYHFHDTGDNSPFRQMSNIENDIYRLYAKGENIAAFLFNIRETSTQKYSLIVRNIRSIAPYFLDFVLVPQDSGSIRLQWKDKQGTVYGVSDLSDGTLRFIALTILFMQPLLPQTLVIDEPELGLHPAAIVKLAGMIQSAAAKNCQVIVATQSTDLVGCFQPENVIAVDQIGGESQFNRLDRDTLKEWLEDYALDDLWRRGIIASGQPSYK